MKMSATVEAAEPLLYSRHSDNQRNEENMVFDFKKTSRQKSVVSIRNVKHPRGMLHEKRGRNHWQIYKRM